MDTYIGLTILAVLLGAVYGGLDYSLYVNSNELPPPKYTVTEEIKSRLFYGFMGLLIWPWSLIVIITFLASNKILPHPRYRYKK